MDFPAFEHLQFLNRAAEAKHYLGGSAFIPPAWDQRGLGDMPTVDPGSLQFDAADLQHRLARRAGLDDAELAITAGTTGANLSAILALVENGTVVCERPYYHPMRALTQGLGARIRYVDRRPETNWRLDPDEVAAACDESTDLILLTSPNNPTGAAASRDDLLALGQIADEVDAYVLVDQVYRELTDHVQAAGLHDRLITTAGFNKTWGAPGIRTGWIAGPMDIVHRCQGVHETAAMAAAPWGAAVAHRLLDNEATCRQQLHNRLNTNHQTYQQKTGQVVPDKPLTSLVAVEGESEVLCYQWLEDGILLVPGDYFGRPGFVRMGFGGEPDAFAAGLEAWQRARAQTSDLDKKPTNA